MVVVRKSSSYDTLKTVETGEGAREGSRRLVLVEVVMALVLLVVVVVGPTTLTSADLWLRVDARSVHPSLEHLLQSRKATRTRADDEHTLAPVVGFLSLVVGCAELNVSVGLLKGLLAVAQRG